MTESPRNAMDPAEETQIGRGGPRDLFSKFDPLIEERPDLFAELPECKDGFIRIPNRPGHGMSLHSKAIDKYRR